MTFRVSGRAFELDRQSVEHSVGTVLPAPISEHYVVVSGRRFPPKQVLSCATGLDRADFTTHQARRILQRLGFVAARVSETPAPELGREGEGPHDGRQAAALDPYGGKWVALGAPEEVLVAAETPQEVLAWLERHDRRATCGMFRVPETAAEAAGLAPL